LSTIQTTAAWVGVRQPTTVVNSTDVQVQQLYALCNEELEEMSKGFQWQVLTKGYSFVTTATAIQATAIPSDWSSFVPETMWNQSMAWPIMGPLSEQDWQNIQANLPAGPIPTYYRMIENTYYLTPTPTAGQTVAYSYVSLNCVLSNLGAEQTSYLADTDTAKISERIISLGTRWRFKAAKGLDYAEDLRTYEREKAIMQGKDRGMKNINMSYQGWGRPFPYVQEGSYPG
jgi:hypothetical protein